MTQEEIYNYIQNHFEEIIYSAKCEVNKILSTGRKIHDIEDYLITFAGIDLPKCLKRFTPKEATISSYISECAKMWLMHWTSRYSKENAHRLEPIDTSEIQIPYTDYDTQEIPEYLPDIEKTYIRFILDGYKKREVLHYLGIRDTDTDLFLNRIKTHLRYRNIPDNETPIELRKTNKRNRKFPTKSKTGKINRRTNHEQSS